VAVTYDSGVGQSSTFGEVTGHELAHGRARLTKDPDSNATSLRLQYKVRTMVNHKKGNPHTRLTNLESHQT